SQIGYRDMTTLLNSTKITQWNAEGLLQMQPAVSPSMTEEETEEYKKLFNGVDTLASENCIKFIIGERSLDEYDAFVQSLKDAGSERLVELTNLAYDRIR
ncbi:MAG TPA: hypothetical protein PKE04_19640, partial [Clostridia bacterium]|nr:hypothetical protein [Clostridia bacterium]